MQETLFWKKLEVVQEPSIPTPAGIRKPDLVAFLPGEWAWVLDLTIISDPVLHKLSEAV
jgi:hypothetical protein